MSHSFPSLKSKEVISALKTFGFAERRSSGSHLIMKNANGKIVVVPMHKSKDIKRGTLFSIIKQAGLTLEEFQKIL